jgi:hypothetical protein
MFTCDNFDFKFSSNLNSNKIDILLSDVSNNPSLLNGDTVRASGKKFDIIPLHIL